jgi:molybdopterin synthase catalytic subunit
VAEAAALFARVQVADFDPGALQTEVAPDDRAGAVVTFTGLVRRSPGDRDFRGLFLEHYPGMTEQALHDILGEAVDRWALTAIGVVHRVGQLAPGARIVWVGAAGPHRAEAFAACEFAMDFLKTRAPFWKKELTADGGDWVEARDSDRGRARRW